eukprot:m.212510 g.212510  ORF g.212510 m.212510 type:complete len:128 (-) comp15854_c0_seq7:2197-2580(-)
MCPKAGHVSINQRHPLLQKLLGISGIQMLMEQTHSSIRMGAFNNEADEVIPSSIKFVSNTDNVFFLEYLWLGTFSFIAISYKSEAQTFIWSSCFLAVATLFKLKTKVAKTDCLINAPSDERNTQLAL